MLDRVAAEIELPDVGSDWRDHARRRAVSAHAVLLRRPRSAALWTATSNLGSRRHPDLAAHIRHHLEHQDDVDGFEFERMRTTS